MKCGYFTSLFCILLFTAPPAWSQQDWDACNKAREEAVEILHKRPFNKWSKSAYSEGITQIRGIISQLETCLSLATSEEARASFTGRIRQLQLRAEAYRLCRDKACPDTDQGNIDVCLGWMANYLNSDTRSLFENTADEQRRKDERQFLLQFSECLTKILSNEEAYKKTSEILKSLFLPPNKLLEAMAKDPDLLTLLLSNPSVFSDTLRTDSLNQQIVLGLTNWLKTDSLAGKIFWEAAQANGNLSASAKLLTRLLLQFQDSPENVTKWNQFLATFPVDDLEASELTKLSAIVTRLEERNWLDITLKELKREEIDLQKLEALKYYESMVDQQSSQEELLNLSKRLAFLSEEGAIDDGLIVYENLLFAGPASRLIDPDVKKGFEAAFETQQKHSGFTIEKLAPKLARELNYDEQLKQIILRPNASLRIEDSTKAKLTSKFKGKSTILVMLSSYLISRDKRQMRIFTSIADLSDGIILFTNTKDFPNLTTQNMKEQFASYWQSNWQTLGSKFSSAGVLTNLLDPKYKWNPDRVKTAAYLGLYLDTERAEAWDKVIYKSISHYLLSDDFWSNAADNAYLINLGKQIEAQLREKFPVKYTSTLVSRYDDSYAVKIDCAADKVDGRRVKIILATERNKANSVNKDSTNNRKRETLAILNINFLGNEGIVDDLQISNAAQMVIKHLEALNTGQTPVAQAKPLFQGTPVTVAETLPTLLLPGIPQLTFAQRLGQEKRNANRILGGTFLIAGSYFIGRALYYETKAIENTSNANINKRNTQLYLLSGVSVISALHALWKVVD